MSIRFQFSNRLEALEEALFERLETSPADPFIPEHILIPGTAIQRRLALKLTRHFGVCANVRFGYLASWLWQRMGRTLINIADESPLAPATLTWRILHLLEDPAIANMPRLREYLAHADPIMRFDLAERIARLFDRYGIYRSDWLTSWALGEKPLDLPNGPGAAADGEWQARLWRRIAEELDIGHSHPIDDFLKKLSEPGESGLQGLPNGFPRGMPVRLTIFALPDLPPLYLKALDGLSRHIEVDAYFLNPCREYWCEIVDQRKQLMLRLKGDEHAETGNRLLAAWGQVTRNHLSLLLDVAGDSPEDETRYVDASDGTVDSILARVQQAILDLEEMAPESLRDMKKDQSIAVHCCHGINRQLEVLHDALLEMFQQDATLSPDDIIIMAPNLTEIAGTIEAVFGGAPKAPPNRHIPYRITGLPLVEENPLARILLKVLHLPDSRFEASRVLDILEEPHVARRFKLSDQDFDQIRGWMREAGIHWGFDATDRQRHGGVNDARHTFDQGIDRLILGYAMPGIGAPLAGLLPTGDIEGSSVETLARFALALENLAEWADYLRTAQPPVTWRRVLDGILDGLMDIDESSMGAEKELRDKIVALEDAWSNAEFNDALPVEIVRAALDDSRGSPPGAQPEGSVTFAPMAAMRGLPYRVVCLLNMNDGEFPASDHPAEFDLMAKQEQRRPGDRQRVQDDRGIFLDALLSARERLLIAYNGKSPRDNKPMPPSLLVSQLLDELAQACAPATAHANELAQARRRFVVEHPLQAFSPRYFDRTDDRLFSYAQEYAAALNAAAGQAPGPESPEPSPDPSPNIDDMSADLDLAEEESLVPESQPRFFKEPRTLADDRRSLADNLAVDQLQNFFRNPARYWLQRCLGMDIPGEEPEISDIEPLLLDDEHERLLRHRLLTLKLSEHGRNLSPEEALRHALAGIELPSGPLGASSFTRLWECVEDFAANMHAAIPDPTLSSVSCHLDLGGSTLTGALTEVHPSGIVRHRMDEIGGNDHLSLWIEHLVLCCIRPKGVELLSSHWGLRDGVATRIGYHSVEPAVAMAHLEELARLYRFGLTGPLPFFPRSAWAFAEAQAAGKSGMAKARDRWTNAQSWPESADRFYRQAFRGIADPLTAKLGPPGDETFQQLAERVFAPALEYLVVDASAADEEAETSR